MDNTNDPLATPRPASVAVVHRESDDRYLLGRSTASDDRKQKWCMVGGGVDAGESPLGAGLRECREEAGLHCKPVGRPFNLPNPSLAHVSFVPMTIRRDHGPLAPNSEFDDMGFFSQQEMADELGDSLYHTVLPSIKLSKLHIPSTKRTAVQFSDSDFEALHPRDKGRFIKKGLIHEPDTGIGPAHADAYQQKVARGRYLETPAQRIGTGNAREWVKQHGDTHISDLMVDREGRAWWKGNGFGHNMTFDLTPNSYSLNQLHNYIKEVAHAGKVREIELVETKDSTEAIRGTTGGTGGPTGSGTSTEQHGGMEAEAKIPAANKVVASLELAFVEALHPRGSATNKGQFTSAAGHATIMVSPEVKTGLRYGTAWRRAAGLRQQKFVTKANEVASSLGLRARVSTAIGDWHAAGEAAGSEPTTVIDVSRIKSFEQLKLFAAIMGRYGNQHSALPFIENANGPHRIYRFDTTNHPAAIQKTLDSHNIPYRTLLPIRQRNGSTRTRVLVFDDHPTTSGILERLQTVRTQHGKAKISEKEGYGEFVPEGSTGREDSQKRYDKIIQDSERGKDLQRNQRRPWHSDGFRLSVGGDADDLIASLEAAFDSSLHPRDHGKFASAITDASAYIADSNAKLKQYLDDKERKFNDAIASHKLVAKAERAMNRAVDRADEAGGRDAKLEARATAKKKEFLAAVANAKFHVAALELEFDESLHPRDHGKFATKEGESPDAEQKLKTPAFKQWFGDWEGDAAHASKVVDEAGDPKLTHHPGAVAVYHGSNQTFDAFQTKYEGSTGSVVGRGIYFAENRHIAESYAVAKFGFRDQHPGIVTAYLNIRNPFRFEQTYTKEEAERIVRCAEGTVGYTEAYDDSTVAGFRMRVEAIADPKTGSINGGDLWYRARKEYGLDAVNEIFQKAGYDGLTHHAATDWSDIAWDKGSINYDPKTEDHGRIWIAFKPQQVKAADNKGTWDSTNPNMHLSFVQRLELGFEGHAGRPGQRGGSVAKGGDNAVTASPHLAALKQKFAAAATNFTGPRQQYYSITVNNVLSRMNPKCLGEINDHLNSVHFYKTFEDLRVDGNKHLERGESPLPVGVMGFCKAEVAGYREPSFHDMLLGSTGKIAIPGEKQSIHLDGGSDTDEKQEGWQGSESIYAHEFGHLIDGGKLKYSSDPQWLDASQDEILKTGQLSDYAMSSPAEAFGEFSRLVWTNPDVARDQFPKCWNFWADHGLVNGRSDAREQDTAKFAKDSDGNVKPPMLVFPSIDTTGPYRVADNGMRYDSTGYFMYDKADRQTHIYRDLNSYFRLGQHGEKIRLPPSKRVDWPTDRVGISSTAPGWKG